MIRKEHVKCYLLAQSEFDTVTYWHTKNCLPLNAEKTNYVVFTVNNVASLPIPMPLIGHKCCNLLTAMYM